MSESKKFYIWSKKHTQGYNHIFWGPNKCGYTIEFPVITKENLHEMKYHDEHTSFAIAVEDVELLGKKMVCVMN